MSSILPLFTEGTQFLAPKSIKVSPLAAEGNMVSEVVAVSPSIHPSTLISASRAKEFLRELDSIMRLNIEKSLAL